MAVWNPRQIATQNINSERGSHQNSANPETPVTMHPSPVRAGIGLTTVATMPFQVVFASCHLASISQEQRQPAASISNFQFLN